jgi:hypothetical protein
MTTPVVKRMRLFRQFLIFQTQRLFADIRLWPNLLSRREFAITITVQKS